VVDLLVNPTPATTPAQTGPTPAILFPATIDPDFFRTLPSSAHQVQGSICQQFDTMFKHAQFARKYFAEIFIFCY
jgi:hypothetical protein